ncbi:hypothetical protein NPIL_444501 [Nephila pilipes]|uniref:Uncharacterized protein n=1 Tax=Nephila pilipes TaxID=299642 RepID=A0A8X6TTI3_NEPPI|nr:hypothetical protein NPIL_444501 [Nephila pilipes]
MAVLNTTESLLVLNKNAFLQFFPRTEQHDKKFILMPIIFTIGITMLDVTNLSPIASVVANSKSLNNLLNSCKNSISPSKEIGGADLLKFTIPAMPLLTQEIFPTCRK